MIDWKLQKVNLKSLKKHPNNPRRITHHEFKQLQNSIEKFGFIDKPIINTDLTIIGGHQRIEVLKKQGAKEVDCWIPDHQLTEREVDELMIRLNRNHAGWDWECLANVFEIPDLMDWGFSAEEIHLDEEEDEPKPKKKKEKTCPNCGHIL